jgi:hypothetical protein
MRQTAHHKVLHIEARGVELLNKQMAVLWSMTWFTSTH